MLFSFIVAGIVLGAVSVFVGWLAGSRSGVTKLAAIEAELRFTQTGLAEMKTELVSLRENHDAECREHTRTKEAMAAKSAQADAERKAADEKLAALMQVEQNLKDTFKALASGALNENAKHLLELSKKELESQRHAIGRDMADKESNITTLLSPMKQSLEQLAQHSQSLEVKRENAYASILGEVRNMQQVHTDLRMETRQLVQALRAPKVRGNWGEMQLRRCIEHAGMVEHASFDVEKFVRKDDGAIRPDVIVRLPNNRCIIVDAKTPLDSFLNAAGTEDEVLRSGYLKEHANRVRKHLDELSAKAYWNQFKESPDFVVCFLPSEVLFSAALENDPALLDHSASTSVLLATPTTLIALLKAVAYGWQQAEIARETEQIKELANKLHAKFVGMHGSFLSIGGALRSAGTAYDDMLKKAEGRGGLFSIARKLREVRIGEKDLPDSEAVSMGPRLMQHEDWGAAFSLAASEEADESTEL